MKDVLALAAFTSSLNRLVRAAVKSGLTEADYIGVSAAVVAAHFPQPALPFDKKGAD